MITDDERCEIAAKIREMHENAPHIPFYVAVQQAMSERLPAGADYCRALADLIDRPTCHDLVEHKQDPFIPGKRMADGYFHCSSCDWSGQLWEYIGFGGMLAYEPVHCPKCGEKIERRR